MVHFRECDKLAKTPGQSHEKLRYKYSQGRCQNQVNSQKGLLIQRIIAVCDFGMLIRTFGLRVSLIVKELRKARKTLAPYVFAYFQAKLSAIALPGGDYRSVTYTPQRSC